MWAAVLLLAQLVLGAAHDHLDPGGSRTRRSTSRSESVFGTLSTRATVVHAETSSAASCACRGC